MPIPISPALAMSAVASLIRFRDRVDSILSLKEATDGLPFLLPPAPTDEAPHLDDMVAFFQMEQGQLILHLNEMVEKFQIFLPNPRSIDSDPIVEARGHLFKLYFEAANVRPATIGPADTREHPREAKGPSTEMRLAYYVVESQRLSRNPALVNLLLATADTLLEFAGQNANLFIANPRTRGVVESLINEFAVNRDFEEEGIGTIFKSLLGSTVVALTDNPGILPNKPALQAVFGALGQVRENLKAEGKDFVAQIVSLDGFERFLGAVAGEVAKDPSFLTQNKLARDVLTATLSRIGTDFKDLVRNPKGLLGVLQVGISAASADVAGILEKKLEGGEPLLSAVLTGVLKQVSAAGDKTQLFTGIENGDVLRDLYKATLTAVAANPVKFGKQSDIEKLASSLITGVAGALAQQNLNTVFSKDTLRLLASESLTVLSANPRFLAGNNQFAVNLLSSVFQAGAKTISDGVSRTDLLDLATAALRASADNAALLKLDSRLTAVIGSVGNALAASNLKELLDPQGRKTLFLSSVQAIAANPVVWGKLQDNEIAQPLIQGLVSALSADRTGLLSGRVFIDSASRLMTVFARKGQMLIDKEVKVETLRTSLSMVVQNLEKEIGRTIDAENLPSFLERVAMAFLQTPARLTADPDAFIAQLVPPILKDLSEVGA